MDHPESHHFIENQMTFNQHHCDNETTNHPASPAFKTPGKYHQAMSINNSYQNSPVSSRMNGGTPRCVKNGHIYNPFEHDVVNYLQGPMFSPNVFTCNGTSTPRKTEGAFVWSIDEQAKLFPAEIDNMPHHQEHLNSIRRDEHTEQQAQAAIDEFFSSQQIVPSPWTDPDRASRPTPQSANPTPSGTRSTPGISRRLKKTLKEVGSQTSLSIPMDVDLTSLLGDFHRDDQAGCEGDAKSVLSTSGTLRRKLFEHHHLTSPLRSSMGDCPPSPHHDVPFSPLATPSSAQFSSSPIRSCSSGKMSSSPGFPMSNYEQAAKKVSSRLFPQRESGEFSSGIRDDCIPSPLSSPDISPIKFSQKNSPADKNNCVRFRETRLDADSSYDSSSPIDDRAGPADGTDMETSQSDAALSGGIGSWGLSTIRESMTDDVMSSDTGYQTGSLTHDSQHHTNLTQQLSHLLPCQDSVQHSSSFSLETPPKQYYPSTARLTASGSKMRTPLRTINDDRGERY